MTDLATLADTLLANFRTVRIPAPEPIETRPGDFLSFVRARLAERRMVDGVRDTIRRKLAKRRHRYRHHLEDDPEGGYRLHFFLANNQALPFLDEIASGPCGPGDPVMFDPEEFLRDRLPDCRWVSE